MTDIIPSLKLAWPICDRSRAYAISLLKQSGMTPDPRFTHVPKYLHLWACVHAGRLLAKDTAAWEADLDKELNRLEEIDREYSMERAKLEQEIEAIKSRQAIAQANLEKALAQEKALKTIAP